MAKNKGSGRRFQCWMCGSAMRKKGTHCKRCKRMRPQAVKSQSAMLVKSYGAVRPVALPKAAKPVCPVCRVKGKRSANCCVRCARPYDGERAIRAEKAASRTQLSIVHSAAWWEAEAARQYDPAAREHCRAEAQKARRAAGQESAVVAGAIVKAAGAGSIRQAWLQQSDPHMREVLRSALYGNGGQAS